MTASVASKSWNSAQRSAAPSAPRSSNSITGSRHDGGISSSHDMVEPPLEEINALGEDFKLKPVEVIRRFVRLFKDLKYESIITYTLQGDLKTKTIKEVLGKITTFESYRLGLDDPQPSNLALQTKKQEAIKSKKKAMIEDDEDDDEDDLTKQKKTMYFNKDKSKGKGKGKHYKKKFSRKTLIGEWTSDNSSNTSSSSSDDEEVVGLSMIKTILPRALPPPPMCLMITSQLGESEDKSSDDSDDEELSYAELWSMLEQARNIAVKKSKILDVVRKECKLAKDRVGELDSEIKDLVTSHEALNKSCEKHKGDHVELLENYEALELTFEAINIDNLASPSSSSLKSDASIMCDELTTSVEISSLEPFVLEKYHKLKEERKMVMDGFERLTRAKAIYKEILGRNLENNVSHRGLGSYPAAIDIIRTSDSIPEWIKPLLADDYYYERDKGGKVKAKALGPPNKKRKFKSIWPGAAELSLVWVAKGIEANYGEKMKAAVSRSEQLRGRVMVHDTAVMGRPNVADLAVGAAKKWGAEVVIVTSNPEGSRDVVTGYNMAGIPAFGPI
ncbi:hypothetical protein PR202_ga10517 [Eleusine coracana subsp. coracana]|uniref:Uncharacterized protein n=1 Tax=Eleusine coracana subsp. coracana TaxID=191504 RepID=A0AAV5C6Y9_ELECO|nr:hypothetical protein PR202_ga10517 [Eleusine coracana subsp. coracana]